MPCYLVCSYRAARKISTVTNPPHVSHACHLLPQITTVVPAQRVTDDAPTVSSVALARKASHTGCISRNSHQARPSRCSTEPESTLLCSKQSLARICRFDEFNRCLVCSIRSTPIRTFCISAGRRGGGHGRAGAGKTERRGPVASAQQTLSTGRTDKKTSSQPCVPMELAAAWHTWQLTAAATDWHATRKQVMQVMVAH